MFDQKEDVINFIFTKEGRKKYAQGDLNFTYYTFHDDDVVYDKSYVGGSETQSELKERILNKTPRIKHRNIEVSTENLQEDTIGYTNQNVEHKPAFDLRSLSGDIDNVDESGEIPQVNMKDIEFEIRAIPEDSVADQNFEDPADQTNINVFPDGTAFTVLQNTLLLELKEDNSSFEFENFDVELFEVEEDTDEIKRKLTFDEGTFEESYQQIFEPDAIENNDINEENVSFYFDLKIDEEIERNDICRYGYEKLKEEFDCPDRQDMVEQRGTIYESDVVEKTGDNEC